MKRKVIQLAKKTLVVSIPRDIVKKYRINKGDEVDIQEDGDSLIIPLKKGLEKTDAIKIKLLEGNDWYISQVLRNIYTYGYDQVEVSFAKREQILEIKKTVDLLLGYEIIEQKDTYCLIRNVSSPLPKEFETLMRKFFLMILQLLDETGKDLKQSNIKSRKIILDLNSNITKFAGVTRRLLMKHSIYSEKKNTALYFIITRAMMNANNIKYIINYLNSKQNFTMSKPALKFYMDYTKMFRLYYDIIYNKDETGLKTLNNMRKQLVNNDFVSIVENSKGINSVVCHYLAENVRTLATAGGAISELFLAEKRFDSF